MLFHNVWFLILIPVSAGVLVLCERKRKRTAFLFSSGELVRGLLPTVRVRMRHYMFVLRIIIVCLVIIALSRPQSLLEESQVEREGIDIVLALDTSTSMLAEDFTLHGSRVNRLAAVKDVVKKFVNNRQSDRIGLVVFAAGAYTLAPMTLDYGWLVHNLDRARIGMIEDGTAIGSGIAVALNRLKKSEAKGKVLILLTDGRNNAGKISPETAAEAAQALGIKIYTIGAGTKGLAPYPVKGVFGNTVYRQVKIEIDEDTLKKIADKTGARYYRATDTESLQKIYDEINRIEKSPIKERGYREYRELFPWFLVPAFFLLLLEILLKNTLLRRIP